MEYSQKGHRHKNIDEPRISYNDLVDTPATGMFTSLQTYALSSASGTVVVPHTLGRTPTYIRATAIYVAGTSMSLNSFGTWDGTTQQCIYTSKNGATPQANTNSGTLILMAPNTSASDFQAAVVSVDSSNITLTWTKTGSPSGNSYIILEAS